MAPTRGNPRARVAILAAAGLGLPLLAVLAVIVRSGESEPGGCTTRSAPRSTDDVAAVVQGPAPLPWRVYEQPVDEEPLRHNRLHGGIAVQYGDRVPASEIRRLTGWYDADRAGILVAPLPELDDVVRATAWASTLSCSTFQQGAFVEFRDTHRFKGPEQVSREQLLPGVGEAPVVTPQPVRERATISFALPDADRVDVDIRAASGDPVRRLGSFVGSTGQLLRLRWDVRDEAGRRVPAGRYDVVVRPARLPSYSARFSVG